MFGDFFVNSMDMGCFVGLGGFVCVCHLCDVLGRDKGYVVNAGEERRNKGKGGGGKEGL